MLLRKSEMHTGECRATQATQISQNIMQIYWQISFPGGGSGCVSLNVCLLCFLKGKNSFAFHLQNLFLAFVTSCIKVAP